MFVKAYSSYPHGRSAGHLSAEGPLRRHLVLSAAGLALLASLVPATVSAQSIPTLAPPQAPAPPSPPATSQVPTAVHCPRGGSTSDGCASAPSHGSFQIPGAFADYARQSGQTWVGSHPWTWNAAGVDYPVGYSMVTPLKNPAVAGLPNGCVYQSTGNAWGGPRVYCNTYNGQGVKSPVIENYDFSLNGCTTLEFSANVSGTIFIANNNFKVGPNCANMNGFLVKISGGTPSLVFEYNQVDGNSQIYPAQLVSDIVDNSTTGALTLIYNAIVNSSEIPITTPSTGAVSLKYNYIDGWVMNDVVTEHGGVLMQGPGLNATISSTTYAYNTAVTPAAATPSSGTATFTLSAPPGKHVTFANAVIDHNLVVTNLAGGAGGATSISAALAYMNWGIYGNVTLTNNYIDASGALSCIQNVGGGFDVVGSISGNTVTVTAVGTGALYAGAGFRTKATGTAIGVILPYGTVDPNTHARSTGTGGAGTYVITGSGATDTFTVASTTSSPIGKLTEGGNVSLVSGAPITGIGGSALGATCPPLY